MTIALSIEAHIHRINILMGYPSMTGPGPRALRKRNGSPEHHRGWSRIGTTSINTNLHLRDRVGSRISEGLGHSDAIRRQGGWRVLSGLGPEDLNERPRPRALDGEDLRNRLSFRDTARWQGIRNVVQFMVAGYQLARLTE